MALRFTDKQLEAINTLDKSVLVAAAAGSGKTAVLDERILKIILDEGVNVDEMLVVTFTRAAASEMRVRLAAAIRKRLSGHAEDAPRLRDQLNRLYRANISTIDSFALNVVREFFYMIDIEPNFTTCDEIQSELLKAEAISELFEQGFADDDFVAGGSFRSFLRLYGDERSEDSLKAGMLDAYSKLRTIPNYFDWALEAAEELLTTPSTLEHSHFFHCIKEEVIRVLASAYEGAREVERLLSENGLERMFSLQFEPEFTYITGLYTKACTEGVSLEFIEGMADFPKVTLRVTGELTGIDKPTKEDREALSLAYEPIKKRIRSIREAYKTKGIKAVRDKYLQPSLETRLAEMNRTHAHTVYYIRLLQRFEELFTEKKRRRRFMDFAGTEHSAVRILDNPEAAETLRKRFRFVFVDEYQDTNRLQEHLIGRVSRADNVFKVGDLKQSIYKFRQAEPELFQQLYDDYSKGSRTDGKVIDLSQNYRSNDATIRYINTVFTEIMPGYDERARLNTGLEVPREYDFIPEVHILVDGDSDNDGESDPFNQSQGDDEAQGGSPLASSEVDEEIADLSKEEAEARYIADLASSLIGTEFMDTKAGVVRKASPSDITILLRSVKSRGGILSRALRLRGIESQLVDKENYFDTIEISIALSLLLCIDNMKRDIPLIATLHSEVFGWTPEELAKVRIAHTEFLRETGGSKLPRRRPAYWEALSWYVANGEEGDLRDRARHATSKLLEWRQLSQILPLADFVWKVLTDSGYYMMVGAMNGGVMRQANLRILADRAAKYSKDTVASLSSFTSFLEVMKTMGVNNGQAAMVASDEGAITISTIHKSKGLEYPFVIIGGLGNRIRSTMRGGDFKFDPAIGVSLSYIDPSRRFKRSTLVQRAIRANYDTASYQEELRILYVAMTRARNKLIMVGTCKDTAKLTSWSPSPSTYLDGLSRVWQTPCNRHYIRPLDRQVAVNPLPTSTSLVASLPRDMTKEASSLYAEIDRRFRYEYPDADALTAKAKYSVSAIRREEAERSVKAARAGTETDTEAGESSASLGLPRTFAATVDDILDGVTGTDVDEIGNLKMVAADRRRITAADVGVAYHRLMEFVDFGCVIRSDGSVDLRYLETKAEELHGKGVLEEGVFRKLDYRKLASFFESDLGRRAVRAAKEGVLRKEKAFTLRTLRDGRQILVQGVIDCCFPEDGRMVLVDYKTSYVRRGRRHEAEIARLREEYRVQIELYSEALRKGTGMEVGEAYLYLFDTGEAVRI